MYSIKKSVYVHLSCAACTLSAYIAKMHRNFSLYSSLALLPLFFLSFYFSMPLTLHHSLCVCVCVYVVVMQKFKICICRLFLPFSVFYFHYIALGWEKSGQACTKKSSRMVAKKKSIKLHCTVRLLGYSLWQLFENMKLKSFAVLALRMHFFSLNII